MPFAFKIAYRFWSPLGCFGFNPSRPKLIKSFCHFIMVNLVGILNSKHASAIDKLLV